MPRPADARAQAVELERTGDLTGAITAYEVALQQAPDDGDLLAGVARLAGRLDLHEVAAELWGRLAHLQPDRLDAVDGRARCLCELGRYDEAVEALRPALLSHAGEARLWNSLGVVLTQQGDSEAALTFFEEAVRLDPRAAKFLYNRGGVHFDLGDLVRAEADFRAAQSRADNPQDRAAIELARATLLLCRGELARGWRLYESRLSAHRPRAPRFDVAAPLWTPTHRLAGRSLLAIAEQGVGDEIMFANVVGDLIAALTPSGRLHLAVDPRLIALFERSFPAATILPHATEGSSAGIRRSVPALAGKVDAWAPLGSFLRAFRPTLQSFPAQRGYLRPDPARIQHWRRWLGEGPPAVGLSWRSGKLAGDRRRQYPPLSAWAPVLASTGVRFVNVQYSAEAEELAELSRLAGGAILQPPGLDIRNDLDGLAALCAALDLVVSVPNATAALAGACGAQVCFVAAPASWTRLGTETYPWYPGVDSVCASTFGDWDQAMRDLASKVRALPTTPA